MGRRPMGTQNPSLSEMPCPRQVSALPPCDANESRLDSGRPETLMLIQSSDHSKCSFTSASSRRRDCNVSGYGPVGTVAVICVPEFTV